MGIVNETQSITDTLDITTLERDYIVTIEVTSRRTGPSIIRFLVIKRASRPLININRVAEGAAFGGDDFLCGCTLHSGLFIEGSITLGSMVTLSTNGKKYNLTGTVTGWQLERRRKNQRWNSGKNFS